MPQSLEKKLSCGQDIALFLMERYPNCKIIFISGFFNKIKLQNIINTVNPAGLIEKSDLTYDSIRLIFKKVLAGQVYRSEKINGTINEIKLSSSIFDGLNREIIVLIDKGITTKNIPNYIDLSLSAVHKRKSTIKELLNIPKGNDEDIVREARKMGLI
ncbi:DNA-binding response regulator, NarL/FixJ family, contains REC and HTH domains [Flavobacterium segetis]|uniref:DNA-binding response regulator, NarL/FixJ family, contains REC and HTH domains n=2 Tax=Flavobacterium segetis TaxID=271157 RepID=A0A1M5FE12_9FLAO|nr:DNA-binding response regulator, NarL/FixJ family, contains REC and HTH domains [Flavobacterium segetis]